MGHRRDTDKAASVILDREREKIYKHDKSLLVFYTGQD